MADDVYNGLPQDLVAIIAHQEIRNEILKTLSVDFMIAREAKEISEITKKSLIAKCHGLLEEWIAANKPKLLPKIVYREIPARAVKIVDDLLYKEKYSATKVFVALNEAAYNFQTEMEKKYGG